MPAMMLRDGTTIQYEVHGSGPTVALTPGGRSGMESIRPLALRLAEGGYQAIIYDRRNCGASDVIIARRYAVNGGELSESEIWAEDLHELLGRLNLLPCWVGGSSAGSRVSLLLAIRHPEAVKGLLLWMITGGAIAAERLGHQYYEQYIEVAEREGMGGVLKTPFFAERVQQNQSNWMRLLWMDAQEFIAIMRDWRAFFTADTPVIGATEEELRRIAAPAVIVAGDDDIHPTAVAERLHSILSQSEYHSPLWTPQEREALADRPDALAQANADKLAPILLDFLARHEAKTGAHLSP